MSIKGKWIRIQSYKHDGSLHRFWRKSYILENNDEWLVVASRSTQVIEGDGRKWYTKEPAISFFSKTNWFNVIAMLKEVGIVYYTNIASPTVIDRGIAKYIDYDLDVKRFNDKTIKYLDKNEHIRHIENYHYSAELVKIIEYKQDEVVMMMNEDRFPYDDNDVNRLYNLFLTESGK